MTSLPQQQQQINKQKHIFWLEKNIFYFLEFCQNEVLGYNLEESEFYKGEMEWNQDVWQTDKRQNSRKNKFLIY